MSQREHASAADVSEAVRVRLLGGFQVSVGDRVIEQDQWRLRKSAGLVKLLALTPGHRLHREQVMDLLWPDSERKAASNNLRQALHAARRVLDPGPASPNRYLSLRDEQITLCPAAQPWLDVAAFEEAAATARRAGDPAAFRVAIELYAGDLLPDDRYEGWAEERRGALRATYLSLLVDLADLHEERAEHEPAAEALRRAVAEEPTLEEAHASLMRLYALSDRRTQALSQYERLREALLRELAAEPGASTRRLREEIASGRFSPARTPPVGTPPEESPDAGKHNLPARRISFIGREREMLDVKRQLAMTRLLTLTGVGGSGKTRLALEVARGLVGGYEDGVWLVQLAPLSEGELVPQVVAGVLGVKEEPGQPLTDTLVEVLRNNNILLVIDNCEHLVDAAAGLVDAILECPRLRILVTSREALGVAGEVRWPVPSLTVLDPRRSPSAGELERSESARLFAERARRRDPSFALGPGNAATVAEICWRLEGVPLAIELAAARVGALSVEQISERLEDSLRLLTGGDRTTAPRQRTLRRALDWSHELLGERERALFRRLSMFAGGWTLEAAEAVTVGDGVESEGVLDLLSGLVDKSLVVTEAAGEDVARYRLLEPLRQYALEKLEESGESEAVRRRHAAFFTTFAEGAESKIRGPEEAAWLDRLETEHDNIRAALAWTTRQQEVGLGLRLAGALRWFWSMRGYLSEGARWLEEALSGSAPGTTSARAGALFGLGVILKGQGEVERAEARFEEALALYEGLGDRECVADSLAYLGWAVYYQDDIARATTLFEASLAVARESGNRIIIPNVLGDLAWTAYDGGDPERAWRLWDEALALHRKRGNVSGVSVVLQNRGYAELALGNLQRATARLEEGLSSAREVGNKRYVAACLLSLGVAATLREDPERAKALIKEALAIDRELGNKGDVAECLESLAGAVGLLGENRRAARLWGAGWALRETTGWHWWAAERRLLEPQLEAARSRMDEEDWEAAFAEGKAMNLEEATKYALSDERHTAPPFQSAEQPPRLTRREEEVAALVARGLTNREIAVRLVISEHTAATHVARILKKLALGSRSQLAAWVTEQGLPHPNPS